MSSYTALTHWLLRDRCSTDKDSLPQSFRLKGRGSSIYIKILPAVMKEWTDCCASEDAPNNASSASNLANFCFIYLGSTGLTYHWYLAFCYLAFGTSLGQGFKSFYHH